MDMLLPPGIDATNDDLDAEAFDRRVDLIAPVHKALRRFMFDTLIRVGALDTTRDEAVAATAADARRLLDVLGTPRGVVRHALQALQQAPAAQRPRQAAWLYRELTALVTEQLQRMAGDEERRNPLLWLRYTDSELRALRSGQLASLSTEELAESLGWMCDALRPAELAMVLDDLHASVDAATFGQALAVVSARLPDARWDALALALGLPKVVALSRAA